MHIFTDSSVNARHNVAIGSYLFLDNIDLVDHSIKNNIKHIQFNSRSSTIAEFTTINHVFQQLHLLNLDNLNIYLYTDCRNFVRLFNRKDSIKTDNPNYELYMYLIDTLEKFKINVIWTKGHMTKCLQTENYQRIFSFVDKHARRTLREKLVEKP